jgi:hypothetical protein
MTVLSVPNCRTRRYLGIGGLVAFDYHSFDVILWRVSCIDVP